MAVCVYLQLGAMGDQRISISYLSEDILITMVEDTDHIRGFRPDSARGGMRASRPAMRFRHLIAVILVVQDRCSALRLVPCAASLSAAVVARGLRGTIRPLEEKGLRW